MEKQLKEADEGGFTSVDVSNQGAFESVSSVPDRKINVAKTGPGMGKMKPKPMKNRGNRMIDMV